MGSLLVYGCIIVLLLCIGVVRSRKLRVRYLETAYPFAAMLFAIQILSLLIARALS